MKNKCFAAAIVATLMLGAAPLAAAQLTKAREWARVDPSVTASMIEGNPEKYLGRYVKLLCAVGVVTHNPGARVEWGAGSVCGDPNDRVSVVVLIASGEKVRSFDRGQEIRFIGQVLEPLGAYSVVRYDYAL